MSARGPGGVVLRNEDRLARGPGVRLSALDDCRNITGPMDLPCRAAGVCRRSVDGALADASAARIPAVLLWDALSGAPLVRRLSIPLLGRRRPLSVPSESRRHLDARRSADDAGC